MALLMPRAKKSEYTAEKFSVCARIRTVGFLKKISDSKRDILFIFVFLNVIAKLAVQSD